MKGTISSQYFWYDFQNPEKTKGLSAFYYDEKCQQFFFFSFDMNLWECEKIKRAESCFLTQKSLLVLVIIDFTLRCTCSRPQHPCLVSESPPQPTQGWLLEQGGSQNSFPLWHPCVSILQPFTQRVSIQFHSGEGDFTSHWTGQVQPEISSSNETAPLQ